MDQGSSRVRYSAGTCCSGIRCSRVRYSTGTCGFSIVPFRWYLVRHLTCSECSSEKNELVAHASVSISTPLCIGWKTHKPPAFHKTSSYTCTILPVAEGSVAHAHSNMTIVPQGSPGTSCTVQCLYYLCVVQASAGDGRVLELMGLLYQYLLTRDRSFSVT